MSDFGLTPQGFRVKTLQQIREEINDEIREEIGGLDLTENSVLGQIVGIFAKYHRDMFELGLNVYESQYPSTAEGISLDNVAELSGVVRLRALPTQVTVSLTGDQSTQIPIGTQLQASETGDIYVNREVGSITRSDALFIDLEIILAEEVSYTVVINNQSASYAASDSDTLSDIALGLANAINALSIDVTASNNDEFIDIQTDIANQAFSFVPGLNMQINEITSPLVFFAIENGPKSLPAGELNQIITPISGLDSVTNALDGIIGRDRESDSSFRLRRAQSLGIIGSATIEAIRARILQNVPAVLSVNIFENRTNVVDVDGRPAHSFETVVEGGVNEVIANEIWDNKPAGIETFGNESVMITDFAGNSQEVNFSRPVNVYIWFRIDLTIVSGSFPSDGQDKVAENVVDYGSDNFGIGDDVIYQQFFTPIYEVDGIANAELEIGFSSDPNAEPSNFDSANVVIANVEIASFNVARVDVEVL